MAESRLIRRAHGQSARRPRSWQLTRLDVAGVLASLITGAQQLSACVQAADLYVIRFLASLEELASSLKSLLLLWAPGPHCCRRVAPRATDMGWKVMTRSGLWLLLPGVRSLPLLKCFCFWKKNNF